MRPSSAALNAFLLTKRPFVVADLFTLMLYDGTTFRWTSTDQPITYGANTWEAVGPALTRSRWNVKNSIEVPTMDITLLSEDYGHTASNLKLDMHNGLLDGGYFQLHRVYMPTFGNVSLGLVLLFGGKVSTIQVTARGAKISVKGDNLLMQGFAPRNVYGVGCIHALYDSGCTLNPANFTSLFSAGTALNQVFISWAVAPINYASYALGYVTITSGNAAGEVRTIQNVSSSGIALAYPLYEQMSPGDTFTATFGCPRTLSVCGNRFGNTQNYRGFNFIPPAELGI